MKKIFENADSGGEKRKKMTGAFALILIVLIALLFLSSMLQSRDGRGSIISGEDSVSYEDFSGTDEEVRLENILECMSGVGEVHVMIRSSSESGTESVFMTEEEKEKSGEVKGVIVVAEGAENPVVQSRITEAVATACGVPLSCVAVYSMEK